MDLRAKLAHDQLPPDARVPRFSVREGLSRLFDVRVEVALEDPDLDLEALLDTSCLLVLEDLEEGQDPVRFHGVVVEAEAADSPDLLCTYRLRLRPRLAALAHRVRSRLFQKKDAVEIVKEVLKGAGVPEDAAAWRLDRKYQARELCTQYRESELQLVRRLLEHEGIFHWFEHGESGHRVVFGDAPRVHAPIDGQRVLPYTNALDDRREAVTELVFSSALGPDVHVTRDWSWERPGRPLEAELRREGAAGRVWYEYPGGFGTTEQGGRHARDRLDAADASYVLAGRTNCRRLAPGRLFDVEGARPGHLDRDWLLVDVAHAYEEAAGDARRGERYIARFRALPGDATFRPERRTPRPRARGKELAVVTGPPGEEIHVDPMGRVKVHFYWDREGPHDDGSSCWVRVQQVNTEGAMTLPRVGWEVDVGFLDGDPDRPVVLQKLPNRDAMPPHGLPAGKTKMALQSATTGGQPGVNALSMEDGSGGMQLSLVASRDLDVVVGNDHLVQVGTDETEEVGKTLSTRVGGNEEIAIDASQSVSVGGDCTLETVGDKSISVGAADSISVKGKHALTCGGSREEKVGAIANVLANGFSQTVNGSSSRKVGAALCINAVKAIVEEVGGAKKETTGAARIELLRGAHAENVTGSKTLLTAAVLEKTKGDVGLSAGRQLAVTVGGPMVVKAGDSFAVSGLTVSITVGSAQLEVGGTKLVANGSGVRVKAPKMSAAGKALLKVSGTIDYTNDVPKP